MLCVYEHMNVHAYLYVYIIKKMPGNKLSKIWLNLITKYYLLWVYVYF